MAYSIFNPKPVVGLTSDIQGIPIGNTTPTDTVPKVVTPAVTPTKTTNPVIPTPIKADTLATPQPDIQAQIKAVQDQLVIKQAELAEAIKNETKNVYTPPTTTDSSTMPSWLTTYLASVPKPTNPVEAYNTAATAAGIDTKSAAVTEAQNKLEALNAELSGVNTQGTEANLTLEQQAGGRDITSTFLGRQQQEVSRQTAIKALPLQAQVLAQQAIVTGNQNLLKLAQDKLDTTFKLQSDYETNLYNYNKELRTTVYDWASKEQQAKLDAQEKIDSQNFTLLQNNLNNAQTIAATALSNGQSDLAAQITKLDPKSSTFVQDLANLQAKIVKKVEPKTTTEAELKQFINKQIATKEFQSLSDENKKLYIQSQGGNPYDFGY